MKVWLSQNEVEQLLETADGTQQQITFGLGARCGLCSHEILDVAPEDIVDTDAGTMLRVWHGKATNSARRRSRAISRRPS